jgi:hypothetical protein
MVLRTLYFDRLRIPSNVEGLKASPKPRPVKAGVGTGSLFHMKILMILFSLL